jgi:hypothetical protein
MLRPMLLLTALALAATGCATIAAYKAEHDMWQAMADQATRALGSSDVPISLVAGNVGSSGSASCAQGTITLGRDASNVRWLLAHELGHHISGHCGQGLIDEMEANAAAVRVLQVWGDTEQAAVLGTEHHLLMLARYRKGRPLPGHNYCLEVADILKRYPATPDVRAGSECATDDPRLTGGMR